MLFATVIDNSEAEPEGEPEAEAEPEAEKCVVRNMSCVVFPTRDQCQGIGVGGCVSESKITIF